MKPGFLATIRAIFQNLFFLAFVACSTHIDRNPNQSEPALPQKDSTLKLTNVSQVLFPKIKSRYATALSQADLTAKKLVGTLENPGPGILEFQKALKKTESKTPRQVLSAGVLANDFNLVIQFAPEIFDSYPEHIHNSLSYAATAIYLGNDLYNKLELVPLPYSEFQSDSKYTSMSWFFDDDGNYVYPLSKLLTQLDPNNTQEFFWEKGVWKNSNSFVHNNVRPSFGSSINLFENNLYSIQHKTQNDVSDHLKMFLYWRFQKGVDSAFALNQNKTQLNTHIPEFSFLGDAISSWIAIELLGFSNFRVPPAGKTWKHNMLHLLGAMRFFGPCKPSGFSNTPFDRRAFCAQHWASQILPQNEKKRNGQDKDYVSLEKLTANPSSQEISNHFAYPGIAKSLEYDRMIYQADPDDTVLGWALVDFLIRGDMELSSSSAKVAQTQALLPYFRLWIAELFREVGKPENDGLHVGDLQKLSFLKTFAPFSNRQKEIAQLLTEIESIKPELSLQRKTRSTPDEPYPGETPGRGWSKLSGIPELPTHLQNVITRFDLEFLLLSDIFDQKLGRWIRNNIPQMYSPYLKKTPRTFDSSKIPGFLNPPSLKKPSQINQGK